MSSSGSRESSVRSGLVAALAVVGLLVPASVSATAGASMPAASFDPGGWGGTEYVLPNNVGRKAAKLEELSDGRVMAVVLANGQNLGHAGTDVIATRIRATSGTWGPVEVLPLGAVNAQRESFDTFTDSAGRLLVMWTQPAAAPAPAGLFKVFWAWRDTDGSWSDPEELYAVQTDPASSGISPILASRPQIVATGDVATVAWADRMGWTTGMIDVEEDHFHARRWQGGAWGPDMNSDGYGQASIEVQPSPHQSAYIYANPMFVSSPEGRISVAFSLRKTRPVQVVVHPLSDGFPKDDNEPGVWDGIPEYPWTADSTSGWVMHLDPQGEYWSPPRRLAAPNPIPANCASPNLPPVPPLAEYWTQWRTWAQNPGIEGGCRGSFDKVKSASYSGDGRLRIHLEYRSDPTARHTLSSMGVGACDASIGLSDRFCFDRWGPVDWVIDWSDAHIQLQPGDGTPGYGAIHEGRPSAEASVAVPTPAGTFLVKSLDPVNVLRVQRPGGQVDTFSIPGSSSSISAAAVFQHDGQLAIFYNAGTSTSVPGCGLLLYRAGAFAEPTQGCLPGVTVASSFLRDVVQLRDGRLLFLDASAAGAPVRYLAVGDFGSPSPSPSAPAPTPPKPTPPAPTPSPTVKPKPVTMKAKKKPSVKGKPRVGTKLKAYPGSWKPKATKVRYQWYLGSKKITKATKATLKVKKAWKGKRLKVKITVSAPGATKKTVTVKVSGKVK